ncbi:F-box protein At2g27310-like [Trifolium pratense]|uniref:F-box protein At2g27310-like n=1 Tax=Trifolium pratense TaxID=57577 RepID=UPI001E695831|nr:F-box protein At2g27310-like [Trifolium pratense]
MNYFSRLPPDTILTHILSRLDAKSILSISSVSSEFHSLICKNNNYDDQWRKICTSRWPSLLTDLSDKVISISQAISKFPGGHRSFFYDAFPSIRYRNNPPPPPQDTSLCYAVDIYLLGEQKPFRTFFQIQKITIKKYDYWWPTFCEVNSGGNVDFVKVKKHGCVEYLEEKLRLSCVVMEPNIKRAGSLFRTSCKPVVSFTTNKRNPKAKRLVKAVYETVMPRMCYTEMVKFKVKVKCDWEDGEEDRFNVRSIEFRMEKMNGIRLMRDEAAIVLLNAIENGERKNK